MALKKQLFDILVYVLGQNSANFMGTKDTIILRLVIFTFLLFLIEGNGSYQELFPSQSYRNLKLRKYIHTSTLQKR